jgi:hypothetical protein
MEGLLDLLEREVVSDELINLDLLTHVLFDKFRN